MTPLTVGETSSQPPARTPFHKTLYFWVLLAIVVGVVLALVSPDLGVQMKPLGDGFIKLIKMIIAPVIFCTVVTGIAGMDDMKSVGKTGGYALAYFLAVSTLALVIGLVVVNIFEPGVGMNVDPATLDAKSVQSYATDAGKQ
jgi:aerobic C4-dicarboxylate transport protein